MVHEHCRASIIGVDEAVTALAVELTLDDPRSLAHCQNPPPFHSLGVAGAQYREAV